MTQAIPGSTRNRRLGLTFLAVFAVVAAMLIGANRFSGNSANAQTGTASITIVKQGLLGTDTAHFTHDITSGGSFDLTAADNSETFTDLAPGTYHVTEQAMDGYKLTGMGCALNNSRSAPSLASPNGNTLGITVSEGQSLTCTFVNASTQVIQYNVNISKMVDDAAPTEGSFDFTATWTADNLNGGVQTSGNFTLDSANSWMATTASMDAGADYSVVENNIDATCDAGDTYRLVGYSVGATAAEAAAATPGPTASFTDLQSNEYVVVHNASCDQVEQHTVTITKWVDDAVPTEGSFDFTATWTADNLNGGVQDSGAFTLDSANNWTATTVPLDAGADYGIVENNIDATCDAGDTYRLAGYSVGATAEEAAAGTVGDTASFTDLQSDQFVVVHNVSCPVGNSSITIVKDGLTGDAEATFTHDLPNQSSDTFTLTADNNSISFSDLPAGTYHFTEAPMEGWTLVSTGCAFTPPTLAPSDTTGNVLTVVLGDDEDQTCTFTNEPVSNDVTVVKYVDGAPATDGSFTLTETHGDASDTSEIVLDSSDSFQYVASDVPFGSRYGLTENDIDGTCDAGDTYRLAGYSVGSTLDEALAATPTDTLDIASVDADTFIVVWNQDCANIASITIVKDFAPDAAGVEASFTTEGAGLEDFSIAEGAANGRTFDNLNAGAFTFTEEELAGWTIQSIFCSGQSSPSNVLINLGGASATVTLNPGDKVTCTFTNMPDGSEPPTGTGTITIQKTWDADNGPDAVFTTSANLGQTGNTFTLTDADNGDSMEWSDLAVATYTFAETPNDGWTLTAINCTGIAPESIDVDLTAGTLGINLGEDENVVCTFTNSQDETAPTENPSALSPFFPFGEVPAVNVPAVNVPAAPAPSTSVQAPSSSTSPSTTNTNTTAPSSSAPSTNNSVMTDNSSPSAVSPAPITSNSGTSANAGIAPANNDTSAVSGAVTAATPVAPSTGNGSASDSSSASALWLGLGLAALAGIAGVTVFGVTRRR